LQARADPFGVVVGLFEAQTLEGQPRLGETRRDLVFGFVVGEDDDFNARFEQRRDDVALQEVDDCHAVVGRDENAFGHKSFYTSLRARSAKQSHPLIITRDCFVAPLVLLAMTSNAVAAKKKIHLAMWFTRWFSWMISNLVAH